MAESSKTSPESNISDAVPPAAETATFGEAEIHANAAEAPTVAPTANSDPDAPTALPEIPGFEILGILGRGGMGVVYKAHQTSLKRVVALKMILAGEHAGAEHLRRFTREAEAVAQLQHPNIVQIYEVGERNRHPFMILEFVPGGNLTQLAAGKPMEPRAAATLVETLARAVQAAHERGIIHRDLKPANILLTPDRQPKIADFGLAKRLEGDDGQTKSGSFLGTPSYMAPEQTGAKKNAIGPATDVYALGAILYELLTGRPPFKAPTPLETAMLVLSEEPTSPSRLQPSVPRALEAICLKCLRKEPAERYASAAALAEDLRRFSVGEPILARPPSKWERTGHWLRRHRYLIGIAASILLAVALTLGGLWGLGTFDRGGTGSGYGQSKDDVAAGAKPAAGDATANLHAALIPADAMGMISIRLADVWQNEAFANLRRDLLSGAGAEKVDLLLGAIWLEGYPPGDIERLTVIIDTHADDEKPAMIMTTSRPYNTRDLRTAFQDRWQVESLVSVTHAGKTFLAPPPAKTAEDRNQEVPYDGPALHLVDERTFVVGHVGTVRTVLEQKPGELGSEFPGQAVREALQKHQFALAVNGSRANRDLWKRVFPFDGNHWLAQALVSESTLAFADWDSGSNRLKAEVRMRFPSPPAVKQATAMQALATLRPTIQADLMGFFAEAVPVLALDADAARDSRLENWLVQSLNRLDQVKLEFETHGRELVIRSDVPTTAFGTPSAEDQAGLQKLRQQLNKSRSAGQLRSLAIAMHNYHNDYNSLPKPAIYDKSGKPLLSWRVLVLPYLEQQELHRKFKFDEPWDSENNKKLLPLMPKIFAVPGVATKNPFTTHYQICVGPGAMFELNKAFTLGQITVQDGTSNTIMIAEATEAVPWTKPEDMTVEVDKLLPKMGGVFPDGFNAGFGDGSVRFIKKEIYNQSRLLHQLIGRNEGRNDDISGFVK